jgi:hypothetical protein
MAGWVASCAILLEPIVEEIKKVIFRASEIHGDDIPIKVLERGLGKTKIGRIWNYVLDGRPHDSDVPPAVCYFYSPDRKGERPKSHLKDFKGTLHADAYSGYKHLYKSEKYPDNKIDEAACWAHTRRKFYEITLANPDATIANQVLEQIVKIYKIEPYVIEIDKKINSYNSSKLYHLFLNYIKNKDFIGADIIRKHIQINNFYKELELIENNELYNEWCNSFNWMKNNPYQPNKYIFI